MLLGNQKLELLGIFFVVGGGFFGFLGSLWVVLFGWLGFFLPNAYKLQVLGNKPLPPVDGWLLIMVLGTEGRAWTIATSY